MKSQHSSTFLSKKKANLIVDTSVFEEINLLSPSHWSKPGRASSRKVYERIDEMVSSREERLREVIVTTQMTLSPRVGGDGGDCRGGVGARGGGVATLHSEEGKEELHYQRENEKKFHDCRQTKKCLDIIIFYILIS